MLVAIHGFTETDLSWKDVFQGSGIEPATPLLPGHGHKPCPPDTTLSTVAATIAERYRDQAPFDLLGYSLGGRVAMQLAIDHPQVLRRLVLVSSRAGLSADEDRGARRKNDEALAQILEEDGISPFVAWWESNPALRPHRPLSLSLAAHIRCRRLNQDPGGLAAVLRTLGQGTVPPLWDMLPRIQAPTLLIAGEADQRYVTDMRSMAELLPDARSEVVPECGHAVHRECRDTLVNLVRGFLA